MCVVLCIRVRVQIQLALHNIFTYCTCSPVAELQHVASSYGFPPVKVVTLRNEPQVMRTCSD